MIEWRTRYRVDPAPSQWTGLSACWIWLGPISPGGYGQMPRQAHGTQSAHRATFMENGGKFTEDKPQADHLCRVRCCVRHVEAVSQQENLRRSNARRGLSRRDRIDFQAASLAAQRGDWAAYRTLARVDEAPRLTASLLASWTDALRRTTSVGGPGPEGLLDGRSLSDVLAATGPVDITNRLARGSVWLVPVERLSGRLRAEAERIAGGEPTVSLEALDTVLFRKELADVLQVAFA